MISVDPDAPTLNGLLLAGGRSRRMGTEKAAMVVHPDGRAIGKRTLDLLSNHTEGTYLSLRQGQTAPEWTPAHTPIIVDRFPESGPLGGVLSAMDHDPKSAWLVVACDLPLLQSEVLELLIEQAYLNRSKAPFTAYASNSDGLPEPLCAIYFPEALATLTRSFEREQFCPRRILRQENAPLVRLPKGAEHSLDNMNTPEDLQTMIPQQADLSRADE